MSVNRAKSRAAPLKQCAFLGYQIGHKGKLVWTEKVQHRFKEQVRQITSRNRWTLPKGLTRIRHYGYLGSAARKTRLRIRAMLGEIGEPAPKLPEPKPFTCQCCGEVLTFLREIAPNRLLRAPPPKAPRP